METTGPRPDGRRAAADLNAARNAQEAILGLPWPWWLYTANGSLLGAAALLPLLGSPAASGLLVLLVLIICVFNYWAGLRMGAPFAVPRSLGFLVCVAMSAAFLTAAIVAGGSGATWLVWICAAGTVVSYAVGSVLHYRGTRR
ncbi:hypothetical protein ACWGQ2_09995 [Arthrobacter sp. NPDC055585]